MYNSIANQKGESETEETSLSEGCSMLVEREDDRVEESLGKTV